MAEFDWGDFLLSAAAGLAIAAVALVALRAVAGPPPYSTVVSILAILLGVGPFVAVSRWRRWRRR